MTKVQRVPQLQRIVSQQSSDVASLRRAVYNAGKFNDISLSSPWRNYSEIFGAGWPNAGWLVDPSGFVHLRGLLTTYSTPTVGNSVSYPRSVIAKLPIELDGDGGHIYAQFGYDSNSGNRATFRVDVYDDGTIELVERSPGPYAAGAVSYLSLDGIVVQ